MNNVVSTWVRLSKRTVILFSLFPVPWSCAEGMVGFFYS